MLYVTSGVKAYGFPYTSCPQGRNDDNPYAKTIQHALIYCHFQTITRAHGA
mgnify:CR=1 FL=1|jgi:hypothetical protein